MNESALSESWVPIIHRVLKEKYKRDFRKVKSMTDKKHAIVQRILDILNIRFFIYIFPISLVSILIIIYSVGFFLRWQYFLFLTIFTIFAYLFAIYWIPKYKLFENFLLFSVFCFFSLLLFFFPLSTTN
jgi:hypothetical protein